MNAMAIVRTKIERADPAVIAGLAECGVGRKIAAVQADCHRFSFDSKELHIV